MTRSFQFGQLQPISRAFNKQNKWMRAFTRKMEVPNKIPNICASISLLLPLLERV